MLPPLRDALVAICDPSEPSLDAKARWVSENLLIDAAAGGCVKTTRLEQAIETIQALLFSSRTGQLAASHPDLSLTAPNFDEEWSWLGSYATWRAATVPVPDPHNEQSGSGSCGCSTGAGVRSVRHAPTACAEPAPPTLEVDACGLMCPGPVMQLRKSYEGLKPGERLRITATDQAFGRDVASWCRMTGAELLSLDTSCGKVRAVISVVADADAATLEAAARADQKVQVALGDRETRRVIAVPGRLVNFVV